MFKKYFRDELNKPATNLMFHNLQRLLDKAVAETNAQYDPAYILSCLDVQLLTVRNKNYINANLHIYKSYILYLKS